MLGNSDSSLSSVFKRKHNPVAACLKCGWAILQHNLALLPDRKHPEHIRKLTCGYSSVGFVFKCCDTTACHWESWQAPGCWAAASCCRLPWEGQGSLSNQQTADISGPLAFPVAPSPHHIGCLLISQQIDYAAWWIHQILLSESLFIFFFSVCCCYWHGEGLNQSHRLHLSHSSCTLQLMNTQIVITLIGINLVNSM